MRIQVFPIDFMGQWPLLEPKDQELHDLAIKYCEKELAEPLNIRDGYAYAPTGPGLGAVYDWDAIENATVEVV